MSSNGFRGNVQSGRALVVFESMFGNTEQVARAIADGLSARMDVEVVEIGSAPTTLNGIDLLVAGGPTHAFGLSRASTREAAARQAPNGLVSSGIGLREWLASVRGESATAVIATFDTRVRRPRVPGSAARAAHRRLGRLGFRAVEQPKSFWVDGTTGPLAVGELERARRWGTELGFCMAENVVLAS